MNRKITEIMANIRKKANAKKRKRDPKRPIAIWTEKDLIAGEINEAMVAILTTGGCSWAEESGCTMCGYYNDTCNEATESDLLEQLAVLKERYRGQKYLKIFTSGSFLNAEEIPSSAAREFLSSFSEQCDRICIETRAEYVTAEAAEMLASFPSEIEVALGLESSNDRILDEIINKNLTFEQYKNAATVLLNTGLAVKTYLLLKPPLMSERDAIEDCVKSIRDVLLFTNTVSVNPTNVQNFTLVDYLYHRGYYRPPWFYSLAEVFRQCMPHAKERGVRLMSAPSGAGTQRGIHNCKKCDGKYKEAITAISLGMVGVEIFDRIECDCRVKWHCDMDTQDVAMDFYSIG